MCAVLAALHTLGWVVTLSTDISKNEYDKDTILFRHQEPAPAECDWGCIAFSKKDRLRFLNRKSFPLPMKRSYTLSTDADV